MSKIELLGALDEQIFVEFSTQQLAGLGIDRGALIAALQAQNLDRDQAVLFVLAVGLVPVDSKPTRLAALAVSQERFAPCHLVPIFEKTHTRAVLSKPIQTPPVQARPS